MRIKAWRYSAAVLSAVSLLASASGAFAESVDLACASGGGGGTTLIHIDLSTNTVTWSQSQYQATVSTTQVNWSTGDWDYTLDRYSLHLLGRGPMDFLQTRTGSQNIQRTANYNCSLSAPQF